MLLPGRVGLIRQWVGQVEAFGRAPLENGSDVGVENAVGEAGPGQCIQAGRVDGG